MRVAVVVSGGFDSAVLWHMINKLYKGTGATVKPYTVPKVDGSIPVSYTHLTLPTILLV